MLVKNWMSKNPDTISSDLSAKDAINLFEDKRVPFMSVVDDGKFRGLQLPKEVVNKVYSENAKKYYKSF